METKSWQREAIEKCLVEKYPVLVQYAKRYNRRDPEDLVSRVTLHALEKAEKLQDGRNVTGWLCTMMFNLYVNEYRRSRKRKEVELGDDWDVAGSNLGVDEGLQQEDLLLLISELKHVYFIAVYLLAEGFSYKEISDKLQVPIGTMMSRLNRGRALARAAMEGGMKIQRTYPVEGSSAYKILELARQGKTDKEIAEALHITIGLSSVTKSFWRKRGVDIPYLQPNKNKPALRATTTPPPKSPNTFVQATDARTSEREKEVRERLSKKKEKADVFTAEPIEIPGKLTVDCVVSPAECIGKGNVKVIINLEAGFATIEGQRVDVLAVFAELNKLPGLRAVSLTFDPPKDPAQTSPSQPHA